MQFIRKTLFTILTVFLTLGAFSLPASAGEPDADHCAFWEFETPSNYLSGEVVKVDTSSSDIIFDLDTSPTITTPGALLTTSTDPTTLWGSTLPASIIVDVFSVTKTLDDPGTPLVNELDSWITSPPYNLTFTVLEGYYFEAEMQGYAYHFVPANPPSSQMVL